MSTPLYQAAEVLDMAIQVEEDGIAFYTGCAATRASEELAELFEFLADQERLHIKVFTEMKQGLSEYSLPEGYPGQTESYIASLVEDRVFPSDGDRMCTPEEITDEMDAIRIALGMEKSSILFYSGIKDMVRESEQGVIDDVIAEEREHIRRLLSLRHSLESARNQ